MTRTTRQSVALVNAVELAETVDRGVSMSPPRRKSLKRSASAISLASLPTPPRTTHKNTHRRNGRLGHRGGGRGNATAAESSTEEDEATAVEEPKAKRRRLADSKAAEDTFWGVSEVAEPAVAYTPVSPPVSRRSTTTSKPFPVAPSTPQRSPGAALPPMTPSPTMSTPPRRAARLRRDSPSNPFLISPTITIGSEDEDRLPLPEKPTVSYVFRGVKTTFANPHYNAVPSTASQLPIEHPDYEAPEGLGARRLLFKSARTRRSNAAFPKISAK